MYFASLLLHIVMSLLNNKSRNITATSVIVSFLCTFFHTVTVFPGIVCTVKDFVSIAPCTLGSVQCWFCEQCNLLPEVGTESLCGGNENLCHRDAMKMEHCMQDTVLLSALILK
jgi:hypothetical protein